MIRMQVADEDLVEVFIGDHQRRDVSHRPGAQVEDQLFAVTELEQEAGTGLGEPLVRHAGAAGNDADLFLGEDFGPRVVDIAVGHDAVGTDASGLVRRLSGSDDVNESTRLAVLLSDQVRAYDERNNCEERKHPERLLPKKGTHRYSS